MSTREFTRVEKEVWTAINDVFTSREFTFHDTVTMLGEYMIELVKQAPPGKFTQAKEMMDEVCTQIVVITAQYDRP